MNAFDPEEFGVATCLKEECHAQETAIRQSVEPLMPVRKLKIEADGDFWRGFTKPKIRLMGRWLERAGFRPGSQVLVTCLGAGIIELRIANVTTVSRDQSRQASKLPAISYE